MPRQDAPKRSQGARRATLVLLLAAALLLAIPLALAGLSSRNGHSTCDQNMPEGMGTSTAVVQNKSRVTVFPLVLECSYTTSQRPTEADYVTVTHDLGTAWWAGAPVLLLAAGGVWVATKRRATAPQ